MKLITAFIIGAWITYLLRPRVVRLWQDPGDAVEWARYDDGSPVADTSGIGVEWRR